MINRNSKIFIAGHSGLVGSSLVRFFKKKKYSNLILRTRKELDLMDKIKVENFFKNVKPEYVILAAAKVGGIKDNITHQADFIYENITIQTNVIWAAHEYNVKKLFFLGSSCIYPRNSPQPMKEEYFLSGSVEPTNEGYAIAKIAGMKLCEKIYTQYDQQFISCMPTNVYGPGDHFDSDNSHVIPSLIRRIQQAKTDNEPDVLIWGSGKSRREFMHVDDLAEAIHFLFKNYKLNQFVNIGTGNDESIKNLANTIKKIVGYKGKLVFDSSKPEGMPRKLLDVTRIQKLGWKAKINLEDGLKQTYKWYLDNL